MKRRSVAIYIRDRAIALLQKENRELRVEVMLYRLQEKQRGGK